MSDSSLKKILRKLVVANLITSNASKDGGFQLNQSIEDITLKDVIEAISNGDVIEFEIFTYQEGYFLMTNILKIVR